FSTDQDLVDLSNWKFFTVLASVCSASFLGGYDGTCVGTLSPIITDESNALNDVSWYGIAYKLYAFYSTSTIFVISLVTFVIGSILCATAQSSMTFIIGRTVAGLGNAGILSGCNITLVRITPLHRHPFYEGLVGGVEYIALATAPLIAGAIAAYSSWRICFYISIPLGVVPIFTVLACLRLLKTEDQSNQSNTRSTWGKLRQLDLVVWGGDRYAWSSKEVLPLLVVTGTLCLVFALQQYYIGDQATLPLRLLRSRILLFNVLVIFSTAGALYLFTYYLPLYYQALREVATMQSGLLDLSRILGLAIAIVLGGILVTKIGYYLPFMVTGGALMSLGAGLTATFTPYTPLSHIISYQALFGLGCGLLFQQPYTAIHAYFPAPDITPVIVILTFAQFLGAVVTLSISQNVFLNQLSRGLATVVPGLDVTSILQSGATNLKDQVPARKLELALEAYNTALVHVFWVGLGAACVSIVTGLGCGWLTVNGGSNNVGEDSSKVKSKKSRER
ncbi:uncharacterized protein N7496_006345, partial [Penicillium cataractarum]